MESTVKINTFTLLLSAQGWKLAYLLITVVAALVFTAAPVVVLQKHVSLPPAYQLKSQHPLADTAQLRVPRAEGERSHGAKLTPRVVGASLLYLAAKFKLHPFLPATLFGFIFLLAGIQAGYSIAQDKLIALFLGLTFAGLYAISACFSMNFAPKPFDGIALGLIALTLITYQRHWLLFGACAFLSCWTDERALLSLFCIGVFSYFAAADANRIFNRQMVTLVCAILLYAFTRLLAGYALHWAEPDIHDIGILPGLSVQYLPLAAWSCFEGAWLVIILAVVTLFQTRKFYAGAFFVALTLAVIGSCVLVADISRASSFAFPLIVAAFSILVSHNAWTVRELRVIAGSAAAISLLAPNFEIIMGYLIKWIPAWPYYWWPV